MPTVAQLLAKRRSGARQAGPADARRLSAPVVLMVSGGADSTALLLLALTSRLDIQDGRGAARVARERLHVLHVNHHLRGADSDADEAFVRELCAREGVALCVEHATFAELDGENLEAAAREVRYAAARRYVAELCRASGAPRSAARILTAHTASDRTETFFMNAIKGSGPAGLSSIPRRRNIIVRPLLDRTHADLVRYLQVAGQPWREDESNADTSYLRNFVRHKLVPVARERNGSLERTIGQACDILGDEDAFMSQLAATALRSCTRRSQEGLLVLDGARLASSEIAVARRMVRLAVRSLDANARLEMRHVEAVLACVAEGAGSVTLPGGIDARMEFGALSLRTPAAREELAAGWLAVPGSMPLANGCVLEADVVRVPAGEEPVAWARGQLAAACAGHSEGASVVAAAVSASADAPVPAAEPAPAPNTSQAASSFPAPALTSPAAFADVASLGYDPADVAAGRVAVRLWVDAPQPGDVMQPLGMSGRSKKLSDILNEARVPVAERPSVPVVRTSPGGPVVWLPGIRADERFKCGPSSIVLVKLGIRRIAG